MNQALLAAVHYIGAMLLVGTLLTEHMLLAPRLDAALAKKLARIDMIFGITAGVQVLTGVSRVFMEKGSSFYMSNPVFHAKIGLFVLIGLLSIYPTLRFLAWSKLAAKEGAVTPPAGEYRRVLMFVRVELLLILILPFLASMMARGL
ncbi:MAG: DUF2214 family protein [Burkholderiales bacterium]|nr:DUF2214 family protein [Burkholderiales bacterium]